METITKSSKWRNKIQIKGMFKDETTPEPKLIAKLCKSLKGQIDRIIKREDGGNLDEDEKLSMLLELEEIADKFDFLRELTDGTIKEDKFDDYGYEGHGKCQEWFNGYLDELYDIADTRVITKQKVLEKFIWIG